MKVRQLMTEHVFSLSPDDDLVAAKDLMQQHRIRHIPVVNEALEVVGLVSRRDLDAASSHAETFLPPDVSTDYLVRTNTSEIMTRKVVTVEPDDDVRQVAQTMFERKFGCLPVVSDKKLIGVITEADFVRLMAQGD